MSLEKMWRERRETGERLGAERFLVEYLGGARSPLAFLEACCDILRRFPYENLSKLISRNEAEHPIFMPRDAARILDEHERFGAGGTCFALTRMMSCAARTAGFDLQVLLCDMKAGRDIHCVPAIRYGDEWYAIDPGYLIFHPLKLVPGRIQKTRSERMDVELRPAGAGALEVRTCGRTRYVMKLEAADEERFLRAWLASFHRPMMNGIHVSRRVEGGYEYLHDRNLRIQDAEGKRNVKLGADIPVELERRFGIHRKLAERAVELAPSLTRRMRRR